MKKIIIMLFANLFLMTSCYDDLLDKKPLDMISDEDVWKDKALTEAYLVELYVRMSYFGNESGGTGWNGDSYFPCFIVNEVSDECMPQWRDWGESQNGYNYKLGNLKIGGGLLDWWGYNPIRDINVFIERLPQTPLDGNLKTQRMAEARFLRAFSYFAMVKRYGGIPLMTKVQNITDPEDELFPFRDKEEVVYEFIIKEINEIAEDLPKTVEASNLGRPTKWAALSLKSRAALYAGSIAQFGTVALDGVVGISADKKEYFYKIARDAAKDVMDNSPHALYNVDGDKVENFKNIFLVKNNSEVIFAKHHNTVNGLEGGNGWCVDFFQCPRPQGWSRGNLDGPYLEMIEAFEYKDGRSGKLNRNFIESNLMTIDELWGDKDPRFFGTIYTQGTAWKGATVNYYKGILTPNGTIQTNDSYDGILANGEQDVDGTCFGVMKYLDETHDNMGGTSAGWATSSQDWQIFRYAEVLLNYAEAAFELGEAGDALGAINQIRARAGIAKLTSIDRDKIRHERKVELAFEGHRYWDVRRWRTAVKDLSVNGSGLRYILDYNSYKIDKDNPKFKLVVIDNIDGTTNPPLFREENYYLPITLSRTANNPNLVENPGYK